MTSSQSCLFQSPHLNPEGIPEVTPEEVLAQRSSVTLIDVRRPDEFTGELGHIEGAQLVTLGNELLQALDSLDPNKTYVFVCRSGMRSGQATALARSKGIAQSFNLQGGMILWNNRQLPVVR